MPSDDTFIVDDFTRECLAAVVDTSLSGARVVRELNEVIARRGRPCMIVSDNGTELVSRAILGFDYNTVRPHTSLGGLSPSMFASRSHADQNPAGPNL